MYKALVVCVFFFNSGNTCCGPFVKYGTSKKTGIQNHSCASACLEMHLLVLEASSL